MTHYDPNHSFMGCSSLHHLFTFLHHLFTFLIRRMSEYSKHEARIRLDEYMETYGSTNRIFGVEYSNIRIRPHKNAVHCMECKYWFVTLLICQASVGRMSVAHLKEMSHSRSNPKSFT